MINLKMMQPQIDRVLFVLISVGMCIISIDAMLRFDTAEP